MKKVFLCFMSIFFSSLLFAQSNESKERIEGTESPVNIIVTKQEAVFPGGEIAFYKYIVEKMQILYDNDMVPKGGKVIIQFSIDTLGKPIELSLVQNLTPELDLACMEIIRNMPNWEPGKYLNKIPRVTTFAIPFHFIRPKNTRY